MFFHLSQVSQLAYALQRHFGNDQRRLLVKGFMKSEKRGGTVEVIKLSQLKNLILSRQVNKVLPLRIT